MGALRNLHGRGCCLTRGSRESTDHIVSGLEADPELWLLLSKPPQGKCRCTRTLRRLPASSSRSSSMHPSPSSPESYWEYGSGLVPKRVMVHPGWCLPAPPWSLLTLQEGVAHPLENPTGPQREVKGVWWSATGGRGGVTPHWCMASAGQGTVHTSSIFGGGRLGAQDAPSWLLKPCEFPIAGEALARCPKTLERLIMTYSSDGSYHRYF